MYGIIIPIWMIWLIPPYVFIALAALLVLDSLFFMILFRAFRLHELGRESARSVLLGSIFRVWLLSFLADFIGALPLLIIFGLGTFPTEVAWQLNQAVFYNPFTHVGAFFSVFGSILLAALLNLFFTYRFSLKKVIGEASLRLKFCLWFAVLSAPWFFLIPSIWWSPTF